MISAALLACAANVSPITIEAIARVEGGGNVLAVNVNRLRGPQPHPTTLAEAVRVTERFVAEGFTVDVGLMQLNSRNLAGLGYTIEQAFDPCTNIRGGGAILTANYVEAARERGEGQGALKAALSAYNTGNFYRGFANGYVAKYYGPGGVPALAGGVQEAAEIKRAAPLPPLNPYTADTQVYVREASNVRIQ